MTKITREQDNQEYLNRLFDSNKKEESELRELLQIPKADLDDILQLIVQEGLEPHLFRQQFEEVVLWACPVRCGIFNTVEIDNETGEKGRTGYTTPTLAALKALELIKGEK